MKRHPTKIIGYDSLEKAGVDIGKLRYDKLAEVLKALKSELDNQANDDLEKNRNNLYHDVQPLILALQEAGVISEQLFEKYKQYMKDELLKRDKNMTSWFTRIGRSIFRLKPVIKGNIQPDGEKVYHMPGGTHYHKIDINFEIGENYFWTEEEAIAAGFRKSYT